MEQTHQELAAELSLGQRDGEQCGPSVRQIDVGQVGIYAS